MSSSSTPIPDPESKYNRKEKSLGLLCTNFLKLYGRDGVDSLGIDDAAMQLGVEKRRIYDIVNILERIGVLVKKAKNQYSWEGFSAIPLALEKLKQQGIKENFNASIGNTSGKVNDESGGSEVGISDSTQQNIVSELDRVAVNRKEKSLGILTENFIMLLLCSDVELVTLDYAASVLLGDKCNPSSARSSNDHSAAKVRRLYDIANVFTAMNLIEKVRRSESGKSAFKWIGPVKSIKDGSTLWNEKDNARTFGTEITLNSGSSLGDEKDNTRSFGTEINLQNVSTSGNEKHNKRKFGTDITNSVNKKCKVTSLSGKKSAENLSTPLHERHGKDKDMNKTIIREQQQSSKGIVFGPFTPELAPKVGVSGDGNVRETHDWENLASTYRPNYRNQGVNDIFSHYVDAWKKWNEAVDEKQKEAAS